MLQQMQLFYFSILAQPYKHNYYSPSTLGEILFQLVLAQTQLVLPTMFESLNLSKVETAFMCMYDQ